MKLAIVRHGRTLGNDYDIFQQYILPWPQSVQERMGGLSQPVAATFNIILFIPLLIALYLYAFKKEN